MLLPLLIAILAAAPTKIADGVWVIRHADAPDGFPQGNTTVVTGDRETLVVDAPYLPSAARADLAEIRKLTQKPVRWLVNTHWHPDHTRGNAAYAAELPGLAIVAQRETVDLLQRYEPQNLLRYPTMLTRFRDQPAQLAGFERVWAEIKGYSLRFPDVTFERELEIDLGGRRLRIFHPGRGHTLGDAAVFVPDAGLLATGDELVLPVPFFFNGYPADLAASVDAMARLNPRLVVPGHGEVQRDTRALERVAALIRSVVSQVNAQVAQRGSISAKLEDVRKSVDVAAFREQFASSAEEKEEFDEAAGNLIRLAFEQAPK
jgi:glyoxylase-like metal-dependent hydrolase (beta-lactamase superfamily II)